MARVWMATIGNAEQQIDSAVLLEALSDGRLQPIDSVREAGSENAISAIDAARTVRADRRVGEDIRLAVLWTLAALCLLPGLILLINPHSGASYGGSELISYHKVAMGMVFTLAGVIFAAAALAFCRRG